MDIKQQLIEYQSKVAEKSNYRDLPDWVRELMLERLSALLTELLKLEDGQAIGERVISFQRGATRAIADQCGPECHELLADIPDP